MNLMISDIINKVKEIGLFNWVAIWNNQLGKSDYSICNPSCYIEVVTNRFDQLGCEYQGIDLELKFHIISEELDAGNELDIDGFISIFELRDEIVKKFTLYNNIQGGFLTKTSEIQDYNHNNVYHYIITYITHYIDETAVKPDFFIMGATMSTTINVN